MSNHISSTTVTVGEYIEKLKQLPQDAPMYVIDMDYQCTYPFRGMPSVVTARRFKKDWDVFTGFPEDKKEIVII